MSVSFRPPSHHTVLWKLHYSPFLTKCIILEMCLVCLMYLPFFTTNIPGLTSNIIRGACYETTPGSLFNNSWFIIPIWARAITAVNDPLYSISELYWATGPGTCVQLSICTLWFKKIWYYTSASIWKVLPAVSIEHHQLVLSIIYVLSQ